MFQVVKYHYGEAAAFNLLRIGVDDILLQMEALVADLHYACASGNMAVALDLGNKLSLYLHHYDSQPFPVNALADGRDIVRLRRVVELEIDGVIHMPELVNVVEAYLKGYDMPEIILSVFCHLFKPNPYESAAKVRNYCQFQAVT